jgi:hypothetical protein
VEAGCSHERGTENRSDKTVWVLNPKIYAKRAKPFGLLKMII